MEKKVFERKLQQSTQGVLFVHIPRAFEYMLGFRKGDKVMIRPKEGGILIEKDWDEEMQGWLEEEKKKYKR